MKIFRIILIILFSIIDLYCLYASVGYLILGINTPKIIGETTTIFTGSYIMSLIFFSVFLITLSVIIIISKKLKKISKEK